MSSPHLQPSTPPAQDQRRELSNAELLRRASPWLKNAIDEDASELRGSMDTREISAVLAKRYRCPQRLVDLIQDEKKEQYKRGYLALQHGVKTAIDLGRESMQSVLEDCR